MFWYLFFIIFAVIAALCSVDKRAEKKYFYYLMLITIPILAFFAGVRVVGFDYDAYLEHFEEVPPLVKYVRTNLSFELGYELFVSFCKTLSPSFHVFLLIFSFLSLCFAALLCYFYSPYPVLSFYMFFAFSFFTQVMGQIRQPIAIAITLLILIPLFLNHRKTLACIWIIIAGILLHKSLFFLLFFLLIGDKFLSKKQIFFLLGVSFVFYFVMPLCIEDILKILPSDMFLYSAIDAYLGYRSIAITFTMGMVERIAMLIILFYFGMKYRIYELNQTFRLFVNMYLVGVCIYFVFISVSAEFASRGTQALTYALFLALPTILKYVRLKEKYILLGIILAWGIYLSFSFMETEPEIYVPYKSIFL